MEWVGGGGWGGFALPSFFTLPSSIGVVGVVGVVETALGEAPEMSDREALWRGGAQLGPPSPLSLSPSLSLSFSPSFPLSPSSSLPAPSCLTPSLLPSLSFPRNLSCSRILSLHLFSLSDALPLSLSLSLFLFAPLAWDHPANPNTDSN